MNTNKHKFELSQEDERRAQSADSSKAYEKTPGAFNCCQVDKVNHEAHVGHRSQKKALLSITLIKNHSKILKLLQFKKFQFINSDF